MRALSILLAWVAIVTCPLVVRADGFSTTVRAKREQSPPPARHLDLRVGASTSTARPVLCGYVSPIALVGLEACGTGAGFLHDDAEGELAHFRTLWKLGAWNTPVGWMQARFAAGFAELQLVGADAPGFFFTGTDPARVETAGPELGVSVQAFQPVVGRLQVVGDLGVMVAYLHHGDALREPRGRWHANLSFTLGAGF